MSRYEELKKIVADPLRHKETWDSFRSWIFNRDIPYDLQGWGGHPEFFRRLVREINTDNASPLIIEVGSWKGRSAVTIAEELKCRNGYVNTQDPGFLVCVDTWLGAGEFVGLPDDDPKRGLRRVGGYPGIFYQFMQNVRLRFMDDVIIPFPQTSSIAARWFFDNGIQADMIYIDASHEYSDVKEDLIRYSRILADGGILCGDDYCDYWSGVKRAVNWFSEEYDYRLETVHMENGPDEPPSDYWILKRNV